MKQKIDIEINNLSARLTVRILGLILLSILALTTLIGIFWGRDSLISTAIYILVVVFLVYWELCFWDLIKNEYRKNR